MLNDTRFIKTGLLLLQFRANRGYGRRRCRVETEFFDNPFLGESSVGTMNEGHDLDRSSRGDFLEAPLAGVAWWHWRKSQGAQVLIIDH